jgi:hypothetical protein
LETDGACAYCGIKDARVLTIHHLDQSKPKNEAYDNKLVLCHNCHQSHHDRKGATAEELKTIKHRLIIKTLTRPGANAMKQAYRNNTVVAMPFLVNHLVEMGFMKQGETISGWSDDNTNNNEVAIDAAYTLTTAGRKLLEKWKLK